MCIQTRSRCKKVKGKSLIKKKMADIAMLVAEEYERRVKGASRGGDHDQITMMMMIKKNKIDSNGVAQRIKNTTHTFAVNYMWLLEPKSQIGLAASNGVFSA